jgi:hypothetical protein
MQLLERPGYLGKRRDTYVANLNDRHGAGNWRFVWLWGNYRLDFEQACMIYEDAYYQFMLARPWVLAQLVAEGSDVYDDQTSNTYSKCNYMVQESVHTHVQDIAIRRCMLRFGSDFIGDQLIQIRDSRGEHPLSMSLSPGQVPFHMPELIVRPTVYADADSRPWWLPDTVEDFYQSNRYVALVD